MSDGWGNIVAPVHYNTSQVMTQEDWAMCFASFTSAVREALPPTTNIVHNSIWCAPDSSAVRAQIGSADYINLERGYSDTGLTGGTGTYSLHSFMNFIDLVHFCFGAAVIIEEYNVANIDYAVAGYFLTNTGADLVGFNDLGLTAEGWPALCSADIGDADWGARTQAQPGVWTRHFTGGDVYLNEPGNPPATIELRQREMHSAGGSVYTSPITLGEHAGISLFLLMFRNVARYDPAA